MLTLRRARSRRLKLRSDAAAPRGRVILFAEAVSGRESVFATPVRVASLPFQVERVSRRQFLDGSGR